MNQIVLKGKGHYGEEFPVIGPGGKPGGPVGMTGPGLYIGPGGPFMVEGVAIESASQGKTIHDAYTEGGERVPWYIPVPGDEVMLLVAAGQTVTGGMVATPKPAANTWETFVESGNDEADVFAAVLETKGLLTEDTLVHCRWKGHYFQGAASI